MQWTAEILQRFSPEKSEDALFTSLLEVAPALGYEYCSITTLVRCPFYHARAYKRNNYPREGNNFYTRESLICRDLLRDNSLLVQTPQLWDEQLFTGHRALWQYYQTYGVRHGVSQTVHGSDGVSSVLSLARRREAISATELDEQASDIVWLANLMHNALAPRVAQLARCQLRGRAARAGLSNRELEVLKLTAKGMTSTRVAKVLRLTERTVNFHVASCVHKLGACNKLSAVVKATMGGLI